LPTSWSAKRQAAALRGKIGPTSRPDCDNYCKSATDAINGIVIADDSLIVELFAVKGYARVPQLMIVVTPLPGATAQPKKNAPVGGDSAAFDLLEHAGEEWQAS
jgi:Endodeoxyribonuclease RusA